VAKCDQPLIQPSGIGAAARKHVASLVIGTAKSLNSLGLRDIGDDAQMHKYVASDPIASRVNSSLTAS
jgi:hypothetical protein